MANIIDYIKWRGDVTFDMVAPDEVDGLIFSAFSYIQLPDLVSPNFTSSYRLCDLAEQFFSMEEEKQKNYIRKEEDLELLRLMQASKRFANVQVEAYQTIQDTQSETQFAAYTLKLNSLFHAVVFRGTDASLIGWKEDLNLSFIDDLPGQKAAKDYLTYVAKNTLGSLIVCGHSKGGNLSVYAASMVTPRIQKRIKQVYNYDGPGFIQAFLERPGYQNLISRIHTLVPQSSLVGMLLEHEEPYQVVKSSNIGPTQHEPYSWEVLGASFEKDVTLDSGGKFFDQSLHTWLAGLSREQREEFVTAVYDICLETNPEKLSDLVKPQNMLTIVKAFSNTDAQTRDMILSTLGALGKAMTEAMAQK